MVIRGGYSKVFDRIGQGIAPNFDEGLAFGMATSIAAPSGQPTKPTRRSASRAVDIMPPTMPAAPPGGFPQTPPIEAGIITASIDDTLVTPSAHMVNVIIGREISRQLRVRGGLHRPLRP